MFFRTETNNTHTQDHKRVLSTRQRTDSPGLDSCPRFGITSFSKDQALMFLLVDKNKNKQTARPQTDNAARKLRIQTANAADSLTQWHFEAITTLFLDSNFDLQWLSSEKKPLRSNTETNHTTLAFSSCSEAQLLVKAVATHVSLVIGACFQLSSEHTTAR